MGRPLNIEVPIIGAGWLTGKSLFSFVQSGVGTAKMHDYDNDYQY